MAGCRDSDMYCPRVTHPFSWNVALTVQLMRQPHRIDDGIVPCNQSKQLGHMPGTRRALVVGNITKYIALVDMSPKWNAQSIGRSYHPETSRGSAVTISRCEAISWFTIRTLHIICYLMDGYMCAALAERSGRRRLTRVQTTKSSKGHALFEPEKTCSIMMLDEPHRRKSISNFQARNLHFNEKLNVQARDSCHMPTEVLIAASMRNVLLACFAVRTEDLDVAGSPRALADVWEAVPLERALDFTQTSDDHIAFDGPPGFRIYVDLIELGGEIIQQIHQPISLYGGWIASMPDLLLLRAVKVVNDGKDGDKLDLLWLLSKVARTTRFLRIEADEVGYLQQAVESCLGKSGCWVVAALIGNRNEAAARQLLALE
nr:hypothetical protein CFP56_24445 [Quercus suber]